MSIKSQISLIDLTQQLPFNIDDAVKKKLCFGQALLISCGHHESAPEEESEFDSDCESTVEEEEKSKEDDKTKVFNEVNDKVKEEIEAVEEEQEKDDNFTFYFFPDCTKPQPELDPDGSIIMENGFPTLNQTPKKLELCTCARGTDGICECFMKLPCKCGKKTKRECTCQDVKDICICADPKKPALTCVCKKAEICVCDPTQMFPQVTCKCGKIDKVCVCPERLGKFATPICVCDEKPKFDQTPDGEENESTMTSVSSINVAEEESYLEKYAIKIPCECTKPDIKPLCRCQLDKECTCDPKENCTCAIQRLCICEPDSSTKLPPCKSDDKVEICECPTRPVIECKCKKNELGVCDCHPEPKLCTCGDPENCKCFLKCLCIEPCLCDTVVEHEQECICIKDDDKLPICTCSRTRIKAPQKLKRVKVREGYRWCHDIDPRHTYFDYAYDRHDKIDTKLQEREMFKVLGLYDEQEAEEECPIHKVKAPEYVKKVRKASLDCCSTVGGISINVETLGDMEDKFLVQVVSNASKEGAKTGTKLISIVDCNLHTLEENRIEYITKRDVTKERRSYVSITDSGYYNKTTRSCKDKSVVKRFYHSFETAHDFLLEGANVVLLRYIGLARYRGNIKTETISMKGTICESVYVSHGVSQAVVNNTTMYVVKIERHIIEPSGRIYQTLSIVTLRGYLVSHEWADNNYIMHINPLLKIDNTKDMIEEHAPLRERWREDLQLFSDYLDFKSKRTGEGARYMHESGDLTAFVKDYLQAILYLKPQNVIHFTKHYFGAALSTIDLPHNEHFEPTCKHVRYYYLED